MIGDEARLLVEAYAQVLRDFSSLMDTLLEARYDFQRAVITIMDATRLNNAVGHHGDFVLGANFDDSFQLAPDQRARALSRFLFS